MRNGGIHILALAAFGLCAEPSAAQRAQEGTDMKLEDAGFTLRPADTAAKLARIRQLPPRQFIRHTKPGGSYYLYSDPDYCRCVFVGTEQAMKTYRDILHPPPRLPTPIGRDGPSWEDKLVYDMQADVRDTIPNDDDDIIDFKF